MAEISTTQVLYYTSGRDLGLVSQNLAGTDIYSPVNTADTIKVYGRFADVEIATGTATDSSSYDEIGTRHDVALYFKVMSQIFPREHWTREYWKIVGQARGHNNPVSTGRIQQHDF